MKPRLLPLLAASLALSISAIVMAQSQTDPPSESEREALWKEVAEAESKDRPKTAAEALEKIVAGAKAAGAYPEAVRALAKKIAFEGRIQGSRPEELITRLKAEMPDWPDRAQPILETVLAHWYWSYFQQNQWRFLQRTQTAEPPGDDILTWDLARILAEIDSHFTTALAADDELKQIAIAEWDDLLTEGNLPDSFRPTLYDFIAFEALRFYSSGTQAGNQAQDAFRFSSDAPALGTVEQFLAWEIETTDEDSLTVRALHLYQDLLRFHRDDENPDAFIDADLHRLEFAHANAYGETKGDRYNAALERFVNEWGDHRISAVARANWATVLRNENDLVEAHRIASQGADAFPDTPGGNRCANIVTQIEQPTSQISAERVWNQAGPEVTVTYKNLTKVYFRIVPQKWEDTLQRQIWNPDYLGNRQQLEALLKEDPVREWNLDLPATEDYHDRQETVDVPGDLDPGFYAIIASHEENFQDESNNTTQAVGFWVSDLALVMRTSWNAPTAGGFVLDANSGEPIEGAKVTAWRSNRNKIESLEPVTTDANGLFSIKATPGMPLVILAEHDGHRISTMQQYRTNRSGRTQPQEQTFFFTDRSIYRPGQTIYYKGLSAFYNQNNNDYRTIANRKVIVAFNDRNGQEINRHTHQTNEFGSFNGNFTAPRDRLMGRMSIYIADGPSGSTAVTVEEYKRPKFKVEVAPPAEAAALNEEVTIKGTATAYTGAPIDGAEVKYRVVRQTLYPDWWYWCFWWRTPQTGSQEIAFGTAETGIDGTFPITFTAKPDPEVLEKDEPVFRFTVYADVTDSAGETRSGQTTVKVGYTALQASLSANEWQEADKPVQVSVSTTSLDGEGRPAEGSVKIYPLVQPGEVQRQKLNSGYRRWMPRGQMVEPEPDPSNPNSWENGDLLVEKTFSTNDDGTTKLDVELPAGIYRAELETVDGFGKPVQAQLPIRVFDLSKRQFDIKTPFEFAAPKWSLEPGESLLALWGSGYDQARAFVELHHRGKPVLQYWTEPGRTQSIVEHDVAEKYRGGFHLAVTMIRENRAYHEQQRVTVPWSNKNLEVTWETHRSKLEPGAKETWTATVTGPDAEKAVAEVAAALYDQSLDAYLPHNWMQHFSVFYQDRLYLAVQLQNQLNGLQRILGSWPSSYLDESRTYRQLPPELITHHARQILLQRRGAFGGVNREMAAAPMAAGMLMESADMAAADGVVRKSASDKAGADRGQGGGGAGGEPEPQPQPDLDQVSARTNLNETAFFYPHLIASADGAVKMEFTMPEALTSWKFMAFAHDQKLRSGFLTDSVVTAKDLMVQPNPPRFLREGDELEFTVKVVNQSDETQRGSVRLTLSDARTLSPADSALGNAKPELQFEIPAKESRSYSWRLRVPDGQGFLIYKAVASTGKLSDGEEGFLPVLPRRILVTESLALPIRGKGEKSFEFEKLLASAQSNTIEHQSLTLQMVSNPSWYAVMALPYLMEFPHECSEQIFNRYYANSLARHIAESDPKIKRIFEQWRGTETLDSPLEKNEDLKQVMLEETPWVRQSNDESEARRNVGVLFEENRMRNELTRSFMKLAQQQRDDGLWPWFPGGRGNEYITLYITTGFGRLRHLDVEEIEMGPALKSLAKLDAWIDRIYRDILEHGNKEANHLSPLICFYLYGRSFFLEDQAIAEGSKEAVDYFLDQAKKHWVDLRSRQNQAHLAIALKRMETHEETIEDILISLRERSVSDDEMGMFWRDTEFNWWWYRAPIETQAVMIELFDEVAGDPETVEDLKVWLLKQKQTRDWKTTKATADAVYALLLRGTDLLASDALVQVSLAGEMIEPDKIEAGTGFYQERFGKGEIQPQQGRVKLSKSDDGVAWGSLHWQYLESMENITPHEGTPLTLKKTLWVKENSDEGPVLRPVKPGDELGVGDLLTVRIELRTDRDMEYVHLKDQRGSGTEPVNVLSQYKYQDGLAYYESTRDTASHFFIDYLPKGTYVFEYGLRVFHRGEYQSGMANIQCMYAPEFNSHSESFELEVR